jgi:hypothetical protein
MRGWMFLGQFAELRRSLIRKYDLCSIGDVDRGAFEDVPDEVLTTVMSIFRRTEASTVAVALQPTPPTDHARDGGRTARKRAAVLAQVGRFEFDPRSFAVIEGEPIVYWWSKELLERYSSAPKLGATAPAWQGVATTNNARFLRCPHEVDPRKIGLYLSTDPRPSLVSADWVPMIKGAPGWVWMEPLLNVVRWGMAGFMLNLHLECYQEKHPALHLKDNARYFTPGIAFTMIGSTFGARAHRFRSVIGNKGSSVFPREIAITASVMNSSLSRFVLQSLNPGLGFEVGDVNRLPIFPINGST